MFKFEQFYSLYQYDYYVYKIVSLNSILENSNEFREKFIGNKIEKFEIKDFERVIKNEIRQTYFHSIETVYELIFALEPSKTGFEDLELLPNLIKSNWRKNYKRIDSISEDESKLNFLDDELEINEYVISLAQYLFYYGILPDNKAIPQRNIDLIPSSISAIKYGLQILAKDFSKRAEYNSYKHALRIVPAITHFTIMDKEKTKTIMKWDLSNSQTFVDMTKDYSEIKFTTRLFDTKRDVQLTLFVSNLISNIILLRKAAFKQLKEPEGLPILFFGKEKIQNASKVNVKIQDLIHKMTKKNET